MHAAVAFANLSGPLPLELGELAGAIPPRWSRLCTLQALDLSDNLLAGAIPSGLGDLANLTMLNLSGAAVARGRGLQWREDNLQWRHPVGVVSMYTPVLATATPYPYPLARVVIM